MAKHLITYFRREVEFACDQKCSKAWGINGRPRVLLSKNPDDYVHLPDHLLGVAPGPGETVGMSEGGHLKPSATSHDGPPNKWCVRECERGHILSPGEEPKANEFDDPWPNIAGREFFGFWPPSKEDA